MSCPKLAIRRRAFSYNHSALDILIRKSSADRSGSGGEFVNSLRRENPRSGNFFHRSCSVRSHSPDVLLIQNRIATSLRRVLACTHHTRHLAENLPVGFALAASPIHFQCFVAHSRSVPVRRARRKCKG